MLLCCAHVCHLVLPDLFHQSDSALEVQAERLRDYCCQELHRTVRTFCPHADGDSCELIVLLSAPDKDKIVTQFDWDHPKLLADCIPQTDIIEVIASPPNEADWLVHCSAFLCEQEVGISLSGAWLGRGFHEDGFVAGRRAARCVRDKENAKVRLYEMPNEDIEVPPPAIPSNLGFYAIAAVLVSVVYMFLK